MSDIDDRRFRIREALTEEFGEEFARDFMSITPPFNWSDIAMKSDLREIEGRLNTRIESAEMRLNGRVDVLEAKIDRRFAEASQEMHSLMRSQTIAISAIFGGLMTVMTTALSLVAFLSR